MPEADLPATVLRLEAALDRISGAAVRRLETEAARRDGDVAADPTIGTADTRLDEIRDRLDELIVRLRGVLAADPGAGTQ